MFLSIRKKKTMLIIQPKFVMEIMIIILLLVLLFGKLRIISDASQMDPV